MKDKNNVVVMAKNDYICDCCHSCIPKGTRYKRINIKYKGIFHICLKCNKTKDVTNYIIDDDLDSLDLSFNEEQKL